MQKVISCLERVIGIFCALLLVIMSVSGLIQILCRYVLKISCAWPEELMRYLYVWITMLGMTLGVRTESLSAVTTLKEKLCEKNHTAYVIVWGIIWLVQVLFFGIVLYYGILYLHHGVAQSTSALKVSLRLFQAAIPISGALAVAFSLVQAAEFYQKEVRR